jgi:hypothetical protein
MEKFLAMSVICTLSVVAVAALTWWIATKVGYIDRNATFNAANMRTWTFKFALFEAAIFGLVFATASYLVADSALGAAVGGAVAAIVSIGLCQLIGRRAA